MVWNRESAEEEEDFLVNMTRWEEYRRGKGLNHLQEEKVRVAGLIHTLQGLVTA